MSEQQRAERCFWCGKLKSHELTEREVLEKKIQSYIGSYEPCDQCKELFKDGIHVVGVTNKPIVEGMFPISTNGDENLYPTGSMFIANDEFITDMLSEDSEKELLKNVLKERKLMLRNEVVESIVKQAREANVGKDIDVNVGEGESNEEEVQDQSNEESVAGDRV